MKWVKTTVGDFCPFIYGKAIKKQDQLEQGFAVYGSNGVYAYSANKLVESSAVIIGRKGSVGKLHLSQKPCWVSDTAFYVQQEAIEDNYFAYYLLSTLGLEDMNTDAAVPGLNRNNAHRLEIKIPENITDRHKLIEPLITLDKKIKINRKINQTLEQIAQAIFKSWFIDFEPTKAKIAVLDAGGTEEDALLAAMTAISGKNNAELEQYKNVSPEQYDKLKSTAELFPSEMQDSELGGIPKGWSCLSLDGIAHYQNGLALQRYRPESDEDDFLPVVKIAQLRQGYTDGKEKASVNINPACILENGDVVFSWSGSLIVDIWNGGKAALNQHLFRVSSSNFPKWFYYLYTKHHLASFQSIAAAKAVTMGHINRRHLTEALCAVPLDEHLAVFNSTFQSLLDLGSNLVLEAKTLETLRDTLLPRLLSGEIEVSTVAK